MVSGPLQGVRILDLTHVWAGPLGVRFLADLGAEVVKVEAPYGRGPQVFPSEPIGGWMGGAPGPEPWNANALFTKLHRNRRSLCVDLKQQQGRALLLDLVGVSDVLIENFSARAMDSMGLDFATLQAANERIIAVSMPGYGLSGPYRDRVAFGPTVEPLSGLSHMLGYDEQSPRNSAMALMDPIGATHAAGAVLTALRKRQQSGRGCRVEMSLHEGGVCFSGPWLLERQLGGNPRCQGNRHPLMAPHGVFRCCGDDQWLALACADDTQWSALSDMLGLDATMDLSARQAAAAQIDAAIERWTLAREKHEAVELLQAAGVSAGPVNSTPDMVADSQVRARNFFVTYEQFDVPMPGNPIRMHGLDSSQWQRCPGLGEHNAEVLEDWLGMDAGQTRELVSQGVLHDRPPG